MGVNLYLKLYLLILLHCYAYLYDLHFTYEFLYHIGMI